MNTVSIPIWNSQGVLPPIYPGYPGNSEFRAPFQVSLLDFAQQFSMSPERIAILKGFLDFRKQLHAAGLARGFQWINGSFVENVELLRGRAPNDIDVVTFLELPQGETEETLEQNHSTLFDNVLVKQQFSTDSYFVFLRAGYPEKWIIDNSIYWYSMWAHRRDSLLWKGFLEIDLASVIDDESQSFLSVENMERG
jgi:hypothetical protein